MSRDWVAVGWTRSSAVLLGVVLAGLVGCGAGKGDLNGTVTFKDKPVRLGTVTVAASDGSLLNGTIEEDGTYTVIGIPPGPVKIAVSSQDPRTVVVAQRKRNEKPPPAPDASKWVAIPEKYDDHNKSELATTIKTGPNTFNIELK